MKKIVIRISTDRLYKFLVKELPNVETAPKSYEEEAKLLVARLVKYVSVDDSQPPTSGSTEQ